MYFENRIRKDAKKFAVDLDRLSFSTAQDNLQKIYDSFPPEAQIPKAYLFSIKFVTGDEFYRLHTENLMAAGYEQGDAERAAQQRASTQLVSFLDSKNGIFAQAIPNGSGISPLKEKSDFYLNLLANSYAHLILTRKIDISMDEAAEVSGLDTRETLDLIYRNMARNPYVLAEYMRQYREMDHITFFNMYEEIAPDHTNEDKVECLRANLRDGYEAVLFDLDIDSGEYDKFLQQTFDNNLHADLRGRILEFYLFTDEGKKFCLDEMSHARDNLLEELHADTFSLLASYLHFARIESGNDPHFARLSEFDKLKRFKHSASFVSSIRSVDYFTNYAVLELAFAAGSLNKAFLLLHNANQLNADTKKLDPRVAGALKNCCEAYQSKEVLSYLTTRALLEPDYYESLQIASLEELMMKKDPHGELSFDYPIVVAEAALAHEAHQGVDEVATGMMFKNEHIQWQTDNNQPESKHKYNVLGVLRDHLHRWDNEQRPNELLTRMAIAFAKEVNLFRKRTAAV